MGVAGFIEYHGGMPFASKMNETAYQYRPFLIDEEGKKDTSLFTPVDLQATSRQGLGLGLGITDDDGELSGFVIGDYTIRQASLSGITNENWDPVDSLQALRSLTAGLEIDWTPKIGEDDDSIFRFLLGLRGWAGGQRTRASTGGKWSFNKDNYFYLGGNQYYNSTSEEEMDSKGDPMAHQKTRLVAGGALQVGVQLVFDGVNVSLFGRYGLESANDLQPEHQKFKGTFTQSYEPGEGLEERYQYSDFTRKDALANKDSLEFVLRVGGSF